MPVPDEHPALSHIEKTLADSYRKEIDQEENIWRSLPFFMAALALEIAALSAVVDRLPPWNSRAGGIAFALLGVMALATIIAVGLLIVCTLPERFEYVAAETDLLDYTKGLIEDEPALQQQAGAPPFSALITLKETLAFQYATGTQHNRQVNKRRENLRAKAGFAILCSIALMLMVVATTFSYYISHPKQDEPRYAQTPGSPASNVDDQATEPWWFGDFDGTGRDSSDPCDAGFH